MRHPTPKKKEDKKRFGIKRISSLRPEYEIIFRMFRILQNCINSWFGMQCMCNFCKFDRKNGK